MGHSQPLRIYLVYLRVNSKYVHYKILPMAGFEPRPPLVLEATALPTESQPQADSVDCCNSHCTKYFLMGQFVNFRLFHNTQFKKLMRA